MPRPPHVRRDLLAAEAAQEYAAAQAAFDAARRRVNEARERHEDLAVPKLRALVGKTFKYPRNCYSCPKTESDYWAVYAKVVGVKDGHAIAVTFQTDSNGRFEFTRETWPRYGDVIVRSGYLPCKAAEFNREFKRQLARVRIS